MAAKYPLIQLESRIVFYSKGSLKKRHHPVSEAAAQQNRICDTDGGDGGYQRGNRPKENLYAELAKIFSIFQWYNQSPILF